MEGVAAITMMIYFAIPRNTHTRHTRDRFVVHALAWSPDTRDTYTTNRSTFTATLSRVTVCATP